MAAGTQDLLAGLNDAQREAVTAPDGPVLVLAGPGSGKTRVLTHRIAYLIRDRNIHPSAIMAVTFTNKAAGEMKARVERILDDKLKGLQVGTFHAICARLLRREHEHTPQRADFLIYDTDDQLSVVAQTLNELNLDSKKYKPRSLLNAISTAKNELVSPREYVGQGYVGEVTSRVYARYQELLIASNARDFDDLLMDTAVLFRDNAEVREKYQRFYEYLLVDEFQDTNAAQYVLVSQLAAPQNNVFVVGDEDQAIYAFRGADYRNVMQFRKDFPQARVILLEQNYRSTQIILDAARGVIDQNTHRTPKALFTDKLGGSPITVYEAYSDQEEAEYVVTLIEKNRKQQSMDYRDFAVMYRTNAQSRSLEEAFIKEGVPYKLVGGVGFYKRREIRDLLAYLRLVNNPDDSVSFNRIINVPKRGIGKKSVDDFQAWAAKQRYTFSRALEALADGEVSPLGNSGTKKFIEFYEQLRAWQEIAQSNDLAALLDDVISQTKYTLHLHETSDTTDEALERDENVRELRGLLNGKKGIPLSEFLEEIALVADVDSLSEDMNAVTLLTLHAAKGLEYPYVFLTGLEEGILPHMRSFEEPDGMAEERRLLYVGITRAMQRVFLTYAFRRMMFGESSPGIPSRFLRDIPATLTEGMSTKLMSTRDTRSYIEETTWDRPALPARTSASRAPISPYGGSPPRTPPAPAPKDNLKYRTGQNVRHAKFGEGVVIESKRSGGDEEVTVSFRSAGIKRLAASFANLQVLD
ncbi:MAG: UvrD-helicase domain-containing protein [Chloroflexi bacterium]|nr:UvrD-helicase domain-containing protein [Chloroflexota bacterium]MCC6896183.1 UvrD-helicase domain-containing protein [Anaerolineae bacterium]